MPSPKKPAPAKSQPKPSGGSAKSLLRGIGGMGMVGGAGPVGGSFPTAASHVAPDTHSPTNSNAMQPAKAKSQNTQANVIQGRKAPGA